LAFLAVLAIWVVAWVGASKFDLRPGLRSHFFAATDLTGAPARTGIDAELDTRALARGWRFTPPDAFGVRWSGFIFASNAATYTFATTSDDGSQIFIDGRLVVDNGGVHGTATKTGTTVLERGPHAIVVTYFNAGGGYQFDWTWNGGTGAVMRPVPAWVLAPAARNYASLLMVRALDWMRVLLPWLAFALGVWIVRDRGLSPRHQEASVARIARKPALICLAIFAALTVIETWPLASGPAHLSRNDNPDTMLNEWAIAWVAHELPRHPLHLFDANMFYPEKNTLALSESMVVQSAMALPLFLAGASPVLAYNIVLLAGFTLTGWATSVLVAAWTDDWVAGVAAGMLAAYNAHTLTRLPHLQAQHVEFLPLALLALDALLRRPTWRAALLLAVCFVLQSLTSMYLLVFTAIALAVGFVVRPEDWLRRGVLVKAAAAAAIAAVVLLPFLLPYWQLRSAGLGRSLDEAGYFAAGLGDYVTNAARLHTWMAGGSSALFPGFAASALALVTIVSGTAFRDARARMCLAFGACGVVLSFGPAVAPGYEFFSTTIPLLQGIRTSSRFGYLGIFAVAILAGYGVAVIRRAWRATPRRVLAISAVIVAAIFADNVAAPLSYEPFAGIAPIYAAPGQNPPAIVAELPLAPPESQFRDAAALLHSTDNWRPLVNGYSGQTPPGYVQRYIAMNRFPERASVEAMRDAGVNTLFVHTDQYDAAALEAIANTPSLTRVATDGAITLYSLAPRAR
jgi:hypothetical protein